MQAGGNLSVLEHQRRLDQAGYTCSSFQVAEVGFHRTNGQRCLSRAVSAESLGECMSLNRIAHRRAGAMSLDETELGRSNSSVLACFAHKARLSLCTGKRDAIGVPILVRGCSNDYCMD